MRILFLSDLHYEARTKSQQDDLFESAECGSTKLTCCLNNWILGKRPRFRA